MEQVLIICGWIFIGLFGLIILSALLCLFFSWLDDFFTLDLRIEIRELKKIIAEIKGEKNE